MSGSNVVILKRPQASDDAADETAVRAEFYRAVRSLGGSPGRRGPLRDQADGLPGISLYNVLGQALLTGDWGNALRCIRQARTRSKLRLVP